MPHKWELSDDFDPDYITVRNNLISHVDINQSKVDKKLRPFDFDINVGLYISTIVNEDIILPDPNCFVAGNLHNHMFVIRRA